MTLEEFIRHELGEGKIDFTFRADVAADGHLHFYVHPLGRDGLTRDYRVEGNVVASDPCVTGTQHT